MTLFQIESCLRLCRFVDNICICTDPYRNHVVALISPKHDAITELAVKLGKDSSVDCDKLYQDKDIIETVMQSLSVEGKASGLAEKEMPQNIKLVQDPWTPDTQFLTAAMKIRRKQINAHYRKEIEAMFSK